MFSCKRSGLMRLESLSIFLKVTSRVRKEVATTCAVTGVRSTRTVC